MVDKSRTSSARHVNLGQGQLHTERPASNRVRCVALAEAERRKNQQSLQSINIKYHYSINYSSFSATSLTFLSLITSADHLSHISFAYLSFSIPLKAASICKVQIKSRSWTSFIWAYVRVGLFSLDFGYANVKKYSDFYGEDEIIFNPLCTLKIIEIQEKQTAKRQPLQYFVKLEYGSLVETIRKGRLLGENSLTEVEKCKLESAKIWRYTYTQIQNQGRALSSDIRIVKNGRDYWEKYIEIGKNFTEKCYGCIRWAFFQQCNKNFKSS